MSDTEIRNHAADNGMSDDESTSEAAAKKIVDKKAVDVDSDAENDHSASSTNNGFGVDGEPDYKPRKDSSSSSSSSEDDDEEISASSASKKESVSGSAEPPKPASRSESLSHNRKSTSSSSDTDEEPEEELPRDNHVDAPPVPVARKVSLPSPQQQEEDEEVDVRGRHDNDDDDELTHEEREMSKRETVHLDEVHEQEQLHEDQHESESESEDEKPERQEPVVVSPPQTNGGSHDKEESSSSSSEDEKEEEKIQSPPPPVVRHHEEEEKKAPSPRRSLQSPDLQVNEADRTTSPNVPKLAADGSVTKAYMAALNNNNNNNSTTHEHDPVSKAERPSKGVKDITQMYVAKTATPPASPKPVARSKPAKDITQLYTGKFDQTSNGPASPTNIDKLSPKKHNMSTAVDKDAIRKAYDDVRSDTTDTEWAVFKFDNNNSLSVTATGNDFGEFKSHFGNEDRGFGYIRIKTGDEMSKRCKFILVTWVGPGVSVMKKAKMSTDKALMKDIIQNLSVELQLENHGEFNHDYFKTQVDRAAGARYGTGVRDL